MTPSLSFRDSLTHLDAHCGGELLDRRAPDGDAAGRDFGGH